MFAHAVELLSLVVVYGFGCGQIVDTWLNGSIFERIRLFLGRWRDEERIHLNNDQLIVSWFGELVLCPRCFMHWVAALATIHFVYVTDIPYDCGPVSWLAIVAVGQLTYRQLSKEVEDPLMRAARLNDQERNEDA